MTAEEEEELEKLKKENLETIKEVYKTLTKDKEIQKHIEK